MCQLGGNNRARVNKERTEKGTKETFLGVAGRGWSGSHWPSLSCATGQAGVLGWPLQGGVGGVEAQRQHISRGALQVLPIRKSSLMVEGKFLLQIPQCGADKICMRSCHVLLFCPNHWNQGQNNSS